MISRRVCHIKLALDHLRATLSVHLIVEVASCLDSSLILHVTLQHILTGNFANVVAHANVETIVSCLLRVLQEFAFKACLILELLKQVKIELRLMIAHFLDYVLN